MLETLIFQWSIAIAHKFDNVSNIFKRLWDLVSIWSLLLRLKFQANTYSFERVVTLFVGYYFSSGHRAHTYIHTPFCHEKFKIASPSGTPPQTKEESLRRSPDPQVGRGIGGAYDAPPTP